MGEPKNERPDAGYKMEWINDNEFKLFMRKRKPTKPGGKVTGYYKNPRIFFKKWRNNKYVWIEGRR